MVDLRERFEAAQVAAKKLPAKPDNDTLLELYSYFKQGSQGDAGGDRPGAFDFVAGVHQAGGAPPIARGLT
jgi:acyl-CoA-binding protein